jgi:glyoxylase-like metal-dependent hydrolase (beta-lactamase superfamily II)
VIRVETHGEVVFVRMARAVLGRPLYWTGAYLVDGLLLDCGPPALARDLLRALEGRAVDALVLTHHHEDHAGGAALLARARGVRPRIHPAGIAPVREAAPIPIYRRATWGQPAPAEAEPLGAAVETRSLRFEVVPTPGHAADHVCLLERSRGWLFTGDLFLAERLRYLRSDEDVLALLASLRQASRLPAAEVFCAHRGPVRGGVAALARKAAWLEELRGRVLDLLARGLPEREVARRAVGREGLLTAVSGGEFSALNFVRALAPRDPPA